MTIQEAMDAADRLRPNQYTQSDKAGWLSELDGMIKADIIDTHEGGANATFAGYGGGTAADTALIVGEPYTAIYIDYLLTKIDFSNAEYNRYNNDMTMFNTVYSAFADDYNRKHMAMQNSSITV